MGSFNCVKESTEVIKHRDVSKANVLASQEMQHLIKNLVIHILIILHATKLCNSSCTKLCDELGWDLLQTRRKLIEIIYGFSHQCLYELLEPYHPPAHIYNLRTSDVQFKIP